MNNKDILFGNEARLKMAIGIQKLYDAVKVTLGPLGRNVIIEQEYGTPLIINDGVTIAKAIKLPDHFENMGAQIIIEAAEKTNDVVGDGTTTAIILASNLILSCLKLINQGKNPVDIKNQLEICEPLITNRIKEVSHPIKDFYDIRKIAEISANSKEIGQIIYEAYEKVGFDGVINVIESPMEKTTLEIVQGYSYDKGYLSNLFANKDKVILDSPLILLCDFNITSMSMIVPYLEKVVEAKRPILLIANDIEQEVLSNLIINKLRGAINIVVTKSPGFGNKQKVMLEDISVLTNGTIINDLSDEVFFGEASKVIVTKDQTVIINNKENNILISDYIAKLKNQILHESSTYELELLEERIAKLSGGVALIKAGATTESSMKEKKLRIEDALASSKAAIISGTIEGAGKVLYEIAQSMFANETDDICKIINQALRAPFIQITNNAGINYLDLLPEMNQTNLWFDANTKKLVNLNELGIIDPTSVSISAFQNAIEVTKLFITSECAIVNISDDKTPIDENNLL